MKSTLTIIFSLISFFAMAQFDAVEKSMSMSEGEQNGYAIEMRGTDKKKAENIWKDFGKQFGKVDRDRKQDEYLLYQVNISDLGSGKVNVYTRFEKNGLNTTVRFWFKKDGEFINSVDHGKAVRGVKTFLVNYGNEVKKEIIREEIKAEEKSLNELEKDLNKLVKKNEGYHKNIEKAKETIANAERAIEENLIDQETKKKEIEAQKVTLQKVNEKLNTVGKKEQD